MVTLIRKYPLFFYFLLAYAITWAILWPLIQQFEYIQPQTVKYELWHSLGALGPAIGALITVLCLSKTKQRAFWSRFHTRTFLRPVNALLIFSPVFLFLFAIGINWLMKGYGFDISVFRKEKGLTSSLDNVIYLLPMVCYGIFEEIGWRGFALPELQIRFNAWQSSLILFTFWALWHIPMFFYRFDYDITLTIGFAIGLMFGTFLLTGIFNNNNNSVIATIIWHVLWNVFSPLDPEGLSAYMSMSIMIIVIIIFIFWKPKYLSQRHLIHKD